MSEREQYKVTLLKDAPPSNLAISLFAITQGAEAEQIKEKYLFSTYDAVLDFMEVLQTV